MEKRETALKMTSMRILIALLVVGFSFFPSAHAELLSGTDCQGAEEECAYLCRSHGSSSDRLHCLQACLQMNESCAGHMDSLPLFLGTEDPDPPDEPPDEPDDPPDF